MPKIKSYSVSETGKVRKGNEDHVYQDPVRGVYAVADGMGGGSEGARASQMICEALEKGVVSSNYADLLAQANLAIETANSAIFQYAREHFIRQMGSTVALLAFDVTSATRAAIASVGDSRVYRLRGGAAELLTHDHSIGAELEAAVGSSTGARFAARSNPLAHVLTRAIGTEETVKIDWRKIDVSPCDRFVICSDGVHDVVDCERLYQLVGAGELKEAAARLEKEILARGAPDNYSFILIETGEKA